MKKIITCIVFVGLILSCRPSFSQAIQLSRDDQAALSHTNTHRIKTGKRNLPGVNLYKSQSPVCDSITTLFDQNNGLSGAMFDIVTHTDITINYLYTNLSSTCTLNIYYKSGTYMGYENDSTYWTLAGSVNITPNPVDTPTLIPLNLNLNVGAGDTLGFYIASTSGSYVKYTDAISGNEGDVYTDNGDVAILQGAGVSYPFDFVISTRVWNGIIDYCTLPTGLEELKKSSVSVSPNPFHEYTTFIFNNNFNRTIEIYNSSGMLLKSIPVNDKKYNFRKEEFGKGIYLYRIISDNEPAQAGRLIIY